MMKRYADMISGGVLALIGTVMLIESRKIRALMEMRVGPKMMPRIYSVALIVLGLAILINGWLQARRGISTGRFGQLGREGAMRVGATGLLIVFYVAALRPLGFLVTSVIYLFLQILVLGGAAKKWRLLPYLLVSVVVTFGIYFLFYGVFNVFLPFGRIW